MSIFAILKPIKLWRELDWCKVTKTKDFSVPFTPLSSSLGLQTQLQVHSSRNFPPCLHSCFPLRFRPLLKLICGNCFVTEKGLSLKFWRFGLETWVSHLRTMLFWANFLSFLIFVLSGCVWIKRICMLLKLENDFGPRYHSRFWWHLMWGGVLCTLEL